MNYRCIIEDDEGKQLANIQFDLAQEELQTMNDNLAAEIMDKFLRIVAFHNLVKPEDCNTNLYREEWINGI